MPKVVIPTDRNTLVDLASGIVDKYQKMRKVDGIVLPPRDLKTIRSKRRKARRILNKVDALREKANELSTSIDPDIEAIAGALRDIAQYLVRQLKDVEKVKKWGLSFKKSDAADTGDEPTK